MQNFSNISLPEQLRALFLDVTFEDLSWDLHHDFIAARILERGSLQDIKWLRGHWGDIALRDYILNRRGKGLNPRQMRYWQLILDLPADQVDQWIAQFHNSVWGRRTKNELLSGWIIFPSNTGDQATCAAGNQQNFFLVDGTAITVYLAHRQSLDLDWFCQDKFDHPMDFAQQLKHAGIAFTSTQLPRERYMDQLTMSR